MKYTLSPTPWYGGDTQIVAVEKKKRYLAFRHLPSRGLRSGGARLVQAVLALLVWRKALFWLL